MFLWTCDTSNRPPTDPQTPAIPKPTSGQEIHTARLEASGCGISPSQNLWEIYGKSMGNLWDNGLYWDLMVVSWILIGCLQCLPVRFQTLIIRSNPIPSASFRGDCRPNLLTRHKQKVACGVSPFRHFFEHSITDPQHRSWFQIYVIYHGRCLKYS